MSEKTLLNCMNVISEKENFFGLHRPGLNLEGFNAHNKLLEAYKKPHLVKQQNWKN